MQNCNAALDKTTKTISKCVQMCVREIHKSFREEKMAKYCVNLLFSCTCRTNSFTSPSLSNTNNENQLPDLDFIS